MKRKIDYVAHVDSEDQVHWIELEIDDKVFIMDREDVLELFNICQTAFDRMVNVDEAIHPLCVREIVMKEA